jgi:hypothetical protein
MITINEFNDELVNNLTKIDLFDYFNQIHSKFYKNIDISFMEYFLSIIDKRDEFCIEHDKLIEYGVFNSKRSSDILDRINSLKLVENKHFLLRNVPQQDFIKKHGGNNKKKYTLTPYSFKLCLIKSKNTNKYADYYLLLENIFYYYTTYQTNYQNKIISLRDNNIIKLNDKIDELLKENKEQSKEIKELLGYTKDTNKRNIILNDNVGYLTNTVGNLTDTVENLTEKVEEVRYEFRNNLDYLNPPLTDNNKINMFVLQQYKNDLNILRIVRGQNSYLTKKITNEFNVLINKRYHPNPYDLVVRIKKEIREINEAEIQKIHNKFLEGHIDYDEKNDKLKDYRKKPMITMKYNTIELNYNLITLNEFINIINNIDELRFQTHIP